VTRASAQRLGLVTLDQMAGALAAAVDHPASARIVEVPEIRQVLSDPPHTRTSTA
jgi:hypothetical protein